MAWRAGLNEKLRAEANRSARTRRWGLGSLGLGLVTAGIAAMAVVPAMIAGPSALPAAAPIRVATAPTIHADDLLALDSEGAALSDLSGAGLAAPESDLTEGEIRDVLASQML